MLHDNVFSFNGEYYLQFCGTAMGTIKAPCYANIFMAELFVWLSIHTFCLLQIYRRYLYYLVSRSGSFPQFNQQQYRTTQQRHFHFKYLHHVSQLSRCHSTSMEATFPPKLTQNQQTHRHFFYTTVSILDILSNLLSKVNFYVTGAFVLMTNFNDATKRFKYILARLMPLL